MSRQERENMIEFLTQRKDFSTEKLMVMTDAEIEHLYERAYSHHERG
ncbi:BH0509 family protein [Halalkalibacterium halodurans]|nr:BH0509 family protein [Halalkalibacterium halodurans]MDY7221007.1 BH0509 family protein [Halalkalibacterium halodurans]MDY7240246.1 BH0509 family protein [Halalkalibacterium halodurans]MED3645891.1 BH0509 family protein [Halalkalibacterium halodurans]MED4079897.1 BH0509 family protein [Halalkalibacterium halodurans]MED4085284.1 BH0509 family protein [Halalkalibacterium halodurans]